jgi:signal transduction histidine kinase
MALTDMLQNFRNLTNADKKFILEGLSTSSRNLDMVIRDLNQILQIDNAIGEKREQIQFSTILQELMLSISHLVKAEKAQITADFSAAPGICTIRLYLYSIFYNIISNSLKYRNPGSPLRIKISSMKNEHGVQLYFSDNGLGIDLSTQGDKIFGLYNRFHLHKEGKGMGLFMVKTQVEALGGTIRVESELGQGTKFIINLKNEPLST